ncbi:MAG: hypothetical protein HKM07_06715 [Chlamydiae bacterium]|nr:hypothetical protein [Chlamydiota bacterium]
MKYKTCLFLALFSSSLLSAKIEHSILPILEEIQDVKNLDPKKYSTNQIKVIRRALERSDEKIRVVSYNMLFDRNDHKLAPENRFPSRLPRLLEMVESMQPDVLCIQELQSHQVEKLMQNIGNTYGFFYAGKNGDQDGVLYRKDRFTLLEGQTWDIPHKAVGIPLTMVHLLDKMSGKKSYVFNVHLPFFLPDARERVAMEVAKIIRPYAETNAVILTGDMNTFANRPDIKTLPCYDGDRTERLLRKGRITNSRERSLLGHVGPISTFTNRIGKSEGFEGMGTPGIFLDHIFVSRSVLVLAHAVEPALVDGHFASDHMPLIADVIVMGP